MSRLMKWWLNRSIMFKTICTQVGLILVPMAVCIISLTSYIYLDYISTAAGGSYQYSRYVLDSFEAQLLQVKASGNVVLENREIRTILISDAVDDEQVARERTQSLLRSLTMTRSGVQGATLYATHQSGRAAQRILPLWPEDVATQPQGSWIHLKEDGTDNYYWVRPMQMDGKTVGVVSIELVDAMLENLADSIARIIGGDCVVASRDGTILHRSGSEWIADEEVKNYLQYAEGYHSLDYAGYINVLYCTSMDLVFISECHTTPSGSFFSVQGSLLLWMLLGLTVMAVFTIWLHNVGVTRRIKKLTRQIQKVDSLETFRPIPNENETDEIGSLAKSYNDMIHQIADLTQRERDAQMMQQTARFNALQAQIQPHFLYNTLETLRMMADAHDDEEVAEMLFVLGKLMRSSISGKEQETTLKRELENIQNYLKLIKLRFDTLEYAVECDPDMPDIACPRFMLQPLVENSVQHGVSKRRGPGRITVRVQAREDGCDIAVADNGAGIPQERLEEIENALASGSPLLQAQGGIGIVNVHSRVKIFFGDASGIRLESHPGEGTVCTVHIVEARRS